MDEEHRESALKMRDFIESGMHLEQRFRKALAAVSTSSRDAWVDLVLGLGEPHEDVTLPRGCVPYLPCAVDVVLRAIDGARVTASDVFVDIGSGEGRATTLVHLLTGARVVGIELQAPLVARARALAARLSLSRVAYVDGDVAAHADAMANASVLFLYCPFSGERLERLFDDVERIAREREFRICAVDLPLPERAWLTKEPVFTGDLAIYRTTRHVTSDAATTA